MQERDLAICSVSVRPSVRPSHAGIDSKLTTIGSRSFHRRVAQGIEFFDNNFRTLRGLQTSNAVKATILRPSQGVDHK